MSEWFDIGADVEAAAAPGRGLQYGDGLFETIAVRQGEPRLWDYHFERLAAGCARLGLQAPGTSLRRQFQEALARSGADTRYCLAKIIVTATDTMRGYGRTMPSPSNARVGVFSATRPRRENYVEGVTTILCETHLASGSPTAGLKTLNRIEQVLARSECDAVGAFEGFTRDADGHLICGTISNMYVVRDNVVHTPSLDRCGVAGTMRRLVLEVLDRDAVEVRIGDVAVGDLEKADEVFVSNSQIGVVPVRCCDTLRWPVGPVTQRTVQLLGDAGIEECRL